MLISHKHKFIFVHVYKTGGSSVKEALSSYADESILDKSYVNTLLKYLRIPKQEKKDHLKAYEISKIYPNIWNEYFTFAFVRNPWAWQVSLYFYMKQNEEHHQHSLINSIGSFEEYILWRVNYDLVTQNSFVSDPRGEYMVDFVGRTEYIEKHFSSILNYLNIETTLPHKNKSSHDHYSSYYSSESKDILEDGLKVDISKFNYSFSGNEPSVPVVDSRNIS